ncbi:hypothetical protein ENHYD8BJ_80304 [Enhydrobacter sp. 8BJ]|nr:hypothetical protein ENHYD8BJ_80304 [Enhydrobacter sp. 8BJ]
MILKQLDWLIDCLSGSLAQLVERLPYTQNVGGSNPSRPTNLYHRYQLPCSGSSVG